MDKFSFYIKGGRLIDNNTGKPVMYKPTPNVSGALVPEIVILHDTASGLTIDGPVDWLCNKNAKASAHFVVGRDGTVVQLAPTNVKTWHAGKSKYKGRANVNNFSIGIENVNPGWLTSKDGGVTGTFSRGAPTWDAKKYGIHQVTDDAHPGKYYWMSYTVEQVECNIAILRAIKEAYPKLYDIQTHWFISPGRKVDVNPLFPLQRVRDAVLNNRGPVDVVVPTTAEEILPPHVPLAKDEKDQVYDYDGVAKTNLNIRPFPDSPKRFGVIKKGGKIDIERSSVSQKDAAPWYLVKVHKDEFSMREGDSQPDANGFITGFVAASFVELVA